MKNIIDLGGNYIDPADKVQRLVAENAVFVDEDEMGAWIERADFVPSPADVQTAAWLTAITTSNQPMMVEQPLSPETL